MKRFLCSYMDVDDVTPRETVFTPDAVDPCLLHLDGREVLVPADRLAAVVAGDTDEFVAVATKTTTQYRVWMLCPLPQSVERRVTEIHAIVAAETAAAIEAEKATYTEVISVNAALGCMVADDLECPMTIAPSGQRVVLVPAWKVLDDTDIATLKGVGYETIRVVAPEPAHAP